MHSGELQVAVDIFRRKKTVQVGPGPSTQPVEEAYGVPLPVKGLHAFFLGIVTKHRLAKGNEKGCFEPFFITTDILAYLDLTIGGIVKGKDIVPFLISFPRLCTHQSDAAQGIEMGQGNIRVLPENL